MADRCGLWFGTMQRMQWVRTPNAGADMSPVSWGAGGTFLNGGGYQRNAWSSHREYTFEWPDSSSREAAALMQAYRNGTYGRGLIYFIDPLIYDQNILPARWADPSMAIGDEGSPLVYGVYPEGVITSGSGVNNLPVRSAYYNLNEIAPGYRSDHETVFIPIPEGYTLYLGSMHQTTGSGGVFVTSVSGAGNNGATAALTPVPNSASNIVPEQFSGGAGVRIWVGKSAAGSASVTLTAMTARLFKTWVTPPPTFLSGPWTPGLGHSGCRFVGNPTYVANNGINGGRIGYAATFKEVGDWV